LDWEKEGNKAARDEHKNSESAGAVTAKHKVHQ
jgi:hypothetical protein